MSEQMTEKPVHPDEVFTWTAPPEIARSERYRDYSKVTTALRGRPYQWARLGDRTSPSAAYQFALGIRRGRPIAFRPVGDYEGAFKGREVYVRYVGGGAANYEETITEFVDGHIESDSYKMPGDVAEQLEARHERKAPAAPDPEHLFEF